MNVEMVLKCLVFVLMINAYFFLITTSQSSSQEVDKEKGWRGPLCERISCKDELLQKLEEISNRRRKKKEPELEFLEGYIINGNDIIELTKHPEVEIRIKNSIIKNGLIFDTADIEGKRIIKNFIFFIDSTIEKGPNVNYSISAQNIIFNTHVQFIGVDVNGDVDFSESIFDDTSSFVGDHFKENAYFFGVEFKHNAEFSNTIFSRAAIFAETVFNQDGNFIGCTFEKYSVFYKSQFLSTANFNGANFLQSFSPFEIISDQLVNFRRSNLRHIITWNSIPIVKSRFDFRGSTITEADFEDLIFTEDVTFDDVRFGTVELSRDDIHWIDFFRFFKHSLDSGNSNPSKRVWRYLDYQLRNKIVNLTTEIDTYYKENDYVKIDSILSGYGKPLIEDFIKQLNTILKVDGFYNYEYFTDIELSKDLKELLKDTSNLSTNQIMMLNRYLLERSFIDANNIWNQHLIRPIIDEQRLEQERFPIIFRNIIFEKDVYFIRATFYDDIAFENIKFKGEANFSNIRFKEENDWKSGKHKFSMSYLAFDDIKINFYDLPDEFAWVRESNYRIKSIPGKFVPDTILIPIQPISEVYEDLVTTFTRNNNLEQKNIAYYFQRKAELDEATKNKSFFQKLNTSEYRYWILWGWSSGWGTKIWWIIGWYICGLFFFAFIYYSMINKVKVWRQTIETPMPDSVFGTKLFTFPWNFFKTEKTRNKDVRDFNSEVKDFISALKLSKVLLLKIGKRDSYVEGRIMKTLIWIEWVLGFYLFAIFVITLKNTVPIINSLVSQVF